MPSKAIRWKLKPVVVVVGVISLTLIYGGFLYINSISTATTRKVEDVHILWREPNGPFQPQDPGEKGVAVRYDAKKDERFVNHAYQEYGFNQFVSDKISLHRSIPDPRPQQCAHKLYSSVLPKVSVIIIFHNEGWSTLLRTVHTVLDRSPQGLLHEVVLCDDFSSKVHLKKKLEDYILQFPQVKLVRTTQREGLIRARVYGADHSTGQVLLFLDSHCEANVGWLPPLLSEIAKDYRTVVCPTVDFIDHNDFHYRGVDPFIRGTFNWRFDYKEKAINAKQKLERKDETEGVRSPVMAGGLFAISRKFWEEIGKYDPGMYVWGGEQYEISFKLWMCGGQMLNIPCSRVGHVYRRNVPYTYDKPNAVLINFKRVAEVWMGDFKEFLYQKRPEIRHQKHGSIVERMEIRDRNKCKDFKWYLLNVANDTIRTKYEYDRGEGEVVHVDSNSCIDTSGRSSGRPVALSSCHNSYSQRFKWTSIYELRQDPEECLDARYADTNNIYNEKCHELGGNQKFTYDTRTNQFIHGGTGMCLSVPNEPEPSHPIVENCNAESHLQKWKFTLNDPNKPPPVWAQIAQDLPLPENPS